MTDLHYRSFVVGLSVNQKAIHAWQFGSGKEFIHLYGGFHGDEPEGIDLALRFKDHFLKPENALHHVKLIVVPVVNIDGCLAKTRVNTNGVDLNRNFPTKNWSPDASEKKYFPGERANSEPEVRGIVKLIDDYPPKKIFTLHSLIPHQINYDGPAKALAEVMSKVNGYPVTDEIGYHTPGSLGEYAGEEKKIPVITYELPEKISPEKAWTDSLDAFLKAFRYS